MTTAEDSPVISLREYRALKRKIIDYETENRDTIAVLPCSGKQNWYETTDHSALFYYYKVCQKIHKEVNFIADSDSIYDKYHLGYIRSKGIGTIRDRIREVGLYQTECFENHIYYFKLSTRFTDKTIAKLEASEHQRRAQNLTLVSAHNLDPVLHHLLTTVATRLHRVCFSRLDENHKRLNGVAIVTLIDSILENYHFLTLAPSIGTENSFKLLNHMRKDIYTLLIKIQILSETKLWSNELTVSISEPLLKIRDLINAKFIESKNNLKENKS